MDSLESEDLSQSVAQNRDIELQEEQCQTSSTFIVAYDMGW
jgi:hypothetical protein